MRSTDPILKLPAASTPGVDEEFPEPTDFDLLEADVEDEPERIEDEGFDISEFDEEDEGSLYDEDDALFIAGDEDQPDDPDEEDDGDGDGDDDDDDDDDDEEHDWF